MHLRWYIICLGNVCELCTIPLCPVKFETYYTHISVAAKSYLLLINQWYLYKTSGNMYMQY